MRGRNRPNSAKEPGNSPVGDDEQAASPDGALIDQNYPNTKTVRASSPPGTGGVARSAGVVAHRELSSTDHPVHSFQRMLRSHGCPNVVSERSHITLISSMLSTL